MRWAILMILFSLLLASLPGCGVSYKTAAPNDVIDRPDRFQGRRIEISDVPQISRNDFAPPNYFHKGYWTVAVDGQVCVEEINFENENRVVACRRLALKAARAGKEVTVKGKMKQGIVDIEYFEGIKTDTPWYRDQRPYYEHPTYLYNWGKHRPYYWWSNNYYGLAYQPIRGRES
ncbi:hypothetical protein ACFL6S_08250 [Candidatus Poribacteria bacterium]